MWILCVLIVWQIHTQHIQISLISQYLLIFTFAIHATHDVLLALSSTRLIWQPQDDQRSEKISTKHYVARETKMLLYLVVWDNIRFQVWIHRSHLSICLVSVVPSTRERAEHELNKCKCLQINPVIVELISTNRNCEITITMAGSAPPPADVQSSAGAAHHKIHKRDVWTFIDKIRSIKYWDLHDDAVCQSN